MQNVSSPALRSLLELANTLVRDSTALATESWDRDLARQSHAAFERLADLAANLDLDPIRMAALDLYVYLSAFEGHIPPETSELAEIRELALSLEHALGPYQAGEPEVLSAGAAAGNAAEMSASIGLLEMEPPPALVQMLADHGVDLVRLATVEQVPKVIGADLPMAIIASTEQVAALCRVLDGLAQRVPASSNVVVVAVGRGQTDDRLHAMLSGCELYLESLDEPSAALRVLDLASPPGPPFRVLLIDDDEDTRVYLSVLLQQVGIEARAIGDPSQAEAEIADFEPDLLLVDLFMPETDGVTLTMRLRERDDLLVLPIVFLSAEQSEQARMQAIRAGGDDYLTKPVRPRSLIAAVRSRIQRARGVRRQLAPAAAAAASTAEVGSGRLQRGELLSAVSQTVVGESEGVRALFAIRLDQSDVLNQKLGQASASELEQSIDLRLLDVLAEADAIALWQEFGFGLLVQRESPKALQELAERLCKAVTERPFKIQGKDMQLTISVGMALPPANAASLPNEDACDGWISAAFAAVAIAHRLGGNRYDGVLENGPGGVPAERVLMIREAVKRSVSNANMVIEFQPMLQLHGENKGHYALHAKLRDHRAPLGGVPRAEFLQAARSAGTINAIDRHTLSHAFAVLEDLRASGRAARIAVPADLGSYDRAQLQWMHGLLSRNPPLAAGLQVEFDARVLIERPALKGILSVLRKFKVIAVLADAEAELEKIEWYLQLPVTLLRFPCAAVKKIAADDFAMAIEPWKRAGRAIVVDGVDELTDVNRLWSLGVDYLQGEALASVSPRLELERTE